MLIVDPGHAPRRRCAASMRALQVLLVILAFASPAAAEQPVAGTMHQADSTTPPPAAMPAAPASSTPSVSPGAKHEAAVAAAAASRSAPEVLARAPASGGLPALAVGLTDTSLLAAVCRGSCDWSAAADLGLPPQFRSAATRDTVSVLRIGQRRHALQIEVRVGDQRWLAVVAAPIVGSSPVVAHAGLTGFTHGAPGDRQGTNVQVFEKDRGEVDIVVGELSESLQLCGRPTLLRPQVLHTPEMALRGIRFQRLPQAERDAAQRLVAELNAEPIEHPVLRARGASTNKADVAALTDGDTKTAWAEQRGADGSGEFIVANAPSELALSQVHFRFRPEGEVAAAATAPAEIWLAVRGELYHVTFPEGAWTAEAGTVFSVTLPEPVQTDCVAVVLDKASETEAVDVTIAELSARTNVSDEQIAQLALELGGTEQQAERAERLLSALGVVGYRAVDRVFAKLPEHGKLRALSLLGSAPCRLSARVFALAIDGRHGALQEQGERSLRGCAAKIVPRLSELFPRARGARLTVLGELLAELSPVQLVDAAVVQLATSGRERRARLRELLTKVLDAPPAQAAAGRWLVAPDLNTKAKVDLLRAMDKQIVAFQPHAGVVIRHLLGGEPDFRTRYLLLAPLAQLSAVDPAARDALVRFITGDPHPAIRTQAARLAATTPPLPEAVMRAANDDHVRVREAALETLAAYKVQQAAPVIEQRVETDQWPLVRAAGVRALRELSPTPQILGVLADTAELDASPEVRRPAVLSLGLMGGHAHLDVVRDLFREDPDPYVQAAAAAALGQLCDQTMLGELTQSALALSRLGNTERDTIVGRASLAALGRLHPEDLEQRLSAFEHPETPVIAKHAARLTLSHPEPCPR